MDLITRSLIVRVRGDVRPAARLSPRWPGWARSPRAARALGVSEPAVSAAVAALRRDLGDALFVRAGGGHPADARRRARSRPPRPRSSGSRTGSAARSARRAGSAGCSGWRCRRRSPSTCRRRCSTRSRAAGRRSRWPRRSRRRRDSARCWPTAARTWRSGRAAAGARRAPGVETVPFLRYKLIVVAGAAAPPRRRARRARCARCSASAGWSGPARAELARLFAEHGLPAPEQGAFATEAAAQAAAAGGQGVMLAIAHTVHDPLRRGTLRRLDVRGTPRDGMWHAATLARRPALRRRPTRCAASSPRRMPRTRSSPGRGACRPGRFRPPVYVTIWTAVET